MSDSYIRIRNWEKYQHKDVWKKSGGTPPWIKNYTKLLHDDDYIGLPLAARAILHGLWLMYAAAGQDVNKNTSRHLLSTNKGESRHFQEHLDALNHAGFIEFVSQPARTSLATREEESREEVSKPLTALQDHSRETEIPNKQRGQGWVDNLGSYTGCRYVRGTHAFGAVYDVLGTEHPPVDWPHSRPTRQEIHQELKRRKAAHA